jgi:hypothetical protein
MPQGNFPPFLALGKVVVTTAGTPVGLLDAFVWPPAGGVAGGLKSAAGTAKLTCVSILFVVLNLITINTGYVYIGVKGMNKATGSGVIAAIPAAAAGAMNFFTIPAGGWGAGNELAPEDIFLDADTNGNSCLVTATMY